MKKLKPPYPALAFLPALAVLLAIISKGNAPTGHHHGKPTSTPSPSPPPTPTITLAWDAPSDTSNVSGYHLHAGFSAGAENQVIDVGNVIQYTYTGTAGT